MDGGIRASESGFRSAAYAGVFRVSPWHTLSRAYGPWYGLRDPAPVLIWFAVTEGSNTTTANER